MHKINGLQFLISYIDPRDNDLLPINNDDNFHRAITIARPLLRLIIQRKGDSLEEITGYGTMRPKNLISSLLGQTPVKSKSLAISNPHDFRQVSILNTFLNIPIYLLDVFVLFNSRYLQLLMLI